MHTLVLQFCSKRCVSSTSKLLGGKLTPDEIKSLQSLPFLKNLDTQSQGDSEQNSAFNTADVSRLAGKMPKKKLDYLNKKLLVLNPIFRDPVTGMLDYKIRNSEMKNVVPYDMEDSKRLSVTKLLTKQWCELRKLYDIYAQTQIFQSSRVTQGSEIHLVIENQTHKEVQDVVEVVDIYNLENILREFNDKWNKEHNIDEATALDPDQQEMTFCEEDLFSTEWCKNVSKLYDLLTNGEAREILVHGYVNKQTGGFVFGSIDTNSDDLKKEDLILVSGVIDHVFVPNHLEENTRSRATELPSEELDFDIDILLNMKHEPGCEPWTFHLSDVKTRAFNSIPSQENVIQSSKLQVMYYRFLLNSLASAPTDVTFKKLLHNAEYRNLNTKKYLQPEQVFYLFVQFDFFKKDLMSLKEGTFSSALFSQSQQQKCNVSYYSQAKLNYYLNYYYPELNFHGEWKSWPTLEYFAVRMSQLYTHILKKPNAALSDELSIEYYNKYNKLFQRVEFLYNKKLLEAEFKSSVDFWLGKRSVEPINPLIRDNENTYCKHCEYKNYCLWRFEHKVQDESNSESYKKVGDLLRKIHDETL